MKTLMWIGLVGIALIPNVYAIQTTLELRNQCESVETVYTATERPSDVDLGKAVACTAYLRGFMDGLRYMQTVHYALPVMCGDNPSSFRKYAAIYIKYANEHPESWHKPAVGTVAAVVTMTNPCKP